MKFPWVSRKIFNQLECTTAQIAIKEKHLRQEVERLTQENARLRQAEGLPTPENVHRAESIEDSSAPRSGTFAWALHQLMQGRSITCPHWKSTDSLTIEKVGNQRMLAIRCINNGSPHIGEYVIAQSAIFFNRWILTSERDKVVNNSHLHVVK